jgi:hypothetical protein
MVIVLMHLDDVIAWAVSDRIRSLAIRLVPTGNQQAHRPVSKPPLSASSTMAAASTCKSRRALDNTRRHSWLFRFATSDAERAANPDLGKERRMGLGAHPRHEPRRSPSERSAGAQHARARHRPYQAKEGEQDK